MSIPLEDLGIIPVIDKNYTLADFLLKKNNYKRNRQNRKLIQDQAVLNKIGALLKDTDTDITDIITLHLIMKGFEKKRLQYYFRIMKSKKTKRIEWVGQQMIMRHTATEETDNYIMDCRWSTGITFLGSPKKIRIPYPAKKLSYPKQNMKQKFNSGR